MRAQWIGCERLEMQCGKSRNGDRTCRWISEVARKIRGAGTCGCGSRDQKGVYVIIDWHSHNIHAKEARIFFERMAKDYGKHPNVIYEIFNEPDHESWAEVKQYSEELIKAIRAIDSDNIILVGHPHWDQDIHLVAQEPAGGVFKYHVHRALLCCHPQRVSPQQM